MTNERLVTVFTHNIGDSLDILDHLTCCGSETLVNAPNISLATDEQCSPRVMTAEAMREFDEELKHHLYWLKTTLPGMDVVQARAIADRLTKYLLES